MLDEEDLEGIAAYLFTRSRLHPADPCDPRELATALGVAVVHARTRTCGELVGNDPLAILLRLRRDPRAEAMTLAHELAHLGMRRCGVREHDERDADEIARRVLVPSGLVRVETLVRGRCIEELPALCPLVEPRVVLARAQYVLGLEVATLAAA